MELAPEYICRYYFVCHGGFLNALVTEGICIVLHTILSATPHKRLPSLSFLKSVISLLFKLLRFNPGEEPSKFWPQHTLPLNNPCYLSCVFLGWQLVIVLVIAKLLFSLFQPWSSCVYENTFILMLVTFFHPMRWKATLTYSAHNLIHEKWLAVEPCGTKNLCLIVFCILVK